MKMPGNFFGKISQKKTLIFAIIFPYFLFTMTFHEIFFNSMASLNGILV